MHSCLEGGGWRVARVEREGVLRHHCEPKAQPREVGAVGDFVPAVSSEPGNMIDLIGRGDIYLTHGGRAWVSVATEGTTGGRDGTRKEETRGYNDNAPGVKRRAEGRREEQKRLVSVSVRNLGQAEEVCGLSGLGGSVELLQWGSGTVSQFWWRASYGMRVRARRWESVGPWPAGNTAAWAGKNQSSKGDPVLSHQQQIGH